MVILFVSITLIIITFYGKIFFTKQTRQEAKENKRKMEYYNLHHSKTKPTIEDFKTTSRN
jgi:cell division protein FtsL